MKIVSGGPSKDRSATLHFMIHETDEEPKTENYQVRRSKDAQIRAACGAVQETRTGTSKRKPRLHAGTAAFCITGVSLNSDATVGLLSNLLRTGEPP